MIMSATLTYSICDRARPSHSFHRHCRQYSPCPSDRILQCWADSSARSSALPSHPRRLLVRQPGQHGFVLPAPRTQLSTSMVRRSHPYSIRHLTDGFKCQSDCIAGLRQYIRDRMHGTRPSCVRQQPTRRVSAQPVSTNRPRSLSIVLNRTYGFL